MTIKDLAELVGCLAIIQVACTTAYALLVIHAIEKKKDE